MPQERLTKDQKREQARELARMQRDKRLKAQARNRILVRVGATVGVVALLAAVGGGIWLATRPAGPGPANMASDGIVLTGSDGVITAVETSALEADEEPVATDPTEYDAPAHIVTYIDYGCPFCGQFETANGAQLEELVAAGLATVEVHPIAILDHLFVGSEYPTRAANTAACVAATAPDSFFDVNAALFANQPAEGTEGLSNAELIALVEEVGVESDDVAACINDVRYKGWVESATDRATEGPLPNTDEPNVTGTPMVLVNGARYTGSLSDPQGFAAFVAANADFSEVDPAPSPSPTPTPTP